LLVANTLSSQEMPIISAEETLYNFGTVKEEGGAVSYTFKIKNTGNSPLLITRITTSCGCTRPEWTKDPVAPNGTAEVKITYDPEGRPGLFYKTISIYSNTREKHHVLAIRGDVEPKQILPPTIYSHSIGPLQMHTKTITLDTIRLGETLDKSLKVRNEGDTPLTVHLGKLPPYIIAEVHPDILNPEDTGEIIFLMDSRSVGKSGRVVTTIPVRIETVGGEFREKDVAFSANIIDDFSGLSEYDKERAPIAQLSDTQIDFGNLQRHRSGFLGLGGSRVVKTIDITNNGQSLLVIYSISSDNEWINISGGKKEIKPNTTATYRVSLQAKEVEPEFETEIHIVCNDPNGPVRLVKVTAEK